MKRVQHTNKLLFSLFSAAIAIALSVGLVAPGSAVSAQGEEPPSPYVTVQTGTTADGQTLVNTIISGPPHPPAGTEASRAAVEVFPASAKTLTVPAYKWVFGCSAVSGAMIAGFYDRNGYTNMYTGPTGGGLMPLNEPATWSTWSDGYETYPNNPLIASHQGLDGRTTKGSIDDYWVKYGSLANDPYITGGWTQHAWGSAIGDYMKTSQSNYKNSDGSTQFWNYNNSGTKLTCATMASTVAPGDTRKISQLDGTYGRKLFYEAKGYTVTDCYNQNTDRYSGGFSFANYKAQIDAGRPVLINLAGHSIVGVGYADPNIVYIHDTWDWSTHQMTWNGSYSTMQMQSVSIVNLAANAVPTPISPSGVTSDRTPTYTWSKISGATQYRYQLLNGTATVYTKTVASTACGSSTTNCSNTPMTALPYASMYKWHVQAYVSGAWKTYSAYKSFSITNVPTPISPSGTITDTTPTFTWKRIDGATQYQFAVYKGTTTTLAYPMVTVPSSSCGSSTTNCSKTPTNVLPAAGYTWKARAYVGGAWKGWSAAKAFTVSTGGFNSQFNGSAAGWVKRPGAAWNLTGGTTYWTTGLMDYWSSASYNQNFSNFTYQARMKRVDTLDDYYGYASGLVVRGTPTFNSYNQWLNAYHFLYIQFGYGAPTGAFAVFKSVGGVSTAIKPWTFSPAVVQNGWNTLKVVASGSTLKFYINGTLVWSGTDAKFTSGQVGLEMYRENVERLDVDWATLTAGTTSAASAETVEPGQVVLPGANPSPKGAAYSPMP